MISWVRNLIFAILLALATCAAENLKLSQHLDYSSDSQDGPLITADDPGEGLVAGKPASVIIYHEGCFNSKRQARRTVDLYEKYRGRVQFVVVDLDQKQSPAQKRLVKHFYQGSIPHVVVLDRTQKAVYSEAGEVDEAKIAKLLDQALAQ